MGKVYKEISTYKGKACTGMDEFFDAYKNHEMFMLKELDMYGEEVAKQTGALDWIKVCKELELWSLGHDELLESEYEGVKHNRFIAVYGLHKNSVIDRKTGKCIYEVSR